MTYQSVITDERAHLTEGGYLGRLRTTLGVWIEEFAPLAAPDLEATGMWPAPDTRLAGDLLGDARAEIWAEYLHADEAEVLATFTEGSLADTAGCLNVRSETNATTSLTARVTSAPADA